METVRELFKKYQGGDNWSRVDKSHENLFAIGAESVLLRAGDLLNLFFNSKSDANKYLTAEQQEELEKDFNHWCQMNYTNSIIDTSNELCDLKRSSLPLIKHLCENYHPHVTAIITPTSVELLEGKKSYPKILDFVVD